MLQVALEGITWALALPRRPLQAPWKDELDQTPRSGWPKVLDLPGLLGVGGCFPRQFSTRLTGPACSVCCGLSSKRPCSGEPQGNTEIAARGPPQPPSLSAWPLSWLRPGFCLLHLGTQSILFLLSARVVAAAGCLCLFKTEKERNQEVRESGEPRVEFLGPHAAAHPQVSETCLRPPGCHGCGPCRTASPESLGVPRGPTACPSHSRDGVSVQSPRWGEEG